MKDVNIENNIEFFFMFMVVSGDILNEFSNELLVFLNVLKIMKKLLNLN